MTISAEPDEPSVPIPIALLDCLAMFIHQLEITEYVSKDQLHDLKMNVYWPAVHGFYLSMIQTRFNFNDPEVQAAVLAENKSRENLLPPTFMPTNEQEVQFKGWIDAQSYQGLLQRWRNAPSGDLIFTGAIGDYYGKRMAYMRRLEPDNGVRASKNIGWD